MNPTTLTSIRARRCPSRRVIIGDINYIHPFREGNGRTQLQYLKQFAAQAGHPVDLARIDGPSWIAASRSSHAADYGAMAAVIGAAFEPRTGRSGGR